jgi:hypothetical protein
MCYGGCWHVEWLNNVSLANTGADFWINDELGQNSAEPPGDNRLIFKNNIAYGNGRSDWNVRPALVVQGDNTWEGYRCI